MEIKLSGNVNEYLKESYKVTWKLLFKRHIRSLAAIFVIAIIMIVIGLSSNYDVSTSRTRYDDTAASSITNATYYKTHFTLGLGIAFAILSLYAYVSIIRQKNRLIRTRASRKGLSLEYSILITEKEINYNDPELNRLEKWSFFWGYTIYKNYILILRNESYSNSEVIPINKLSEKECEDLLKFLKGTLQQQSN